jgi:hypothetical protein
VQVSSVVEMQLSRALNYLVQTTTMALALQAAIARVERLDLSRFLVI